MRSTGLEYRRRITPSECNRAPVPIDHLHVRGSIAENRYTELLSPNFYKIRTLKIEDALWRGRTEDYRRTRWLSQER